MDDLRARLLRLELALAQRRLADLPGGTCEAVLHAEFREIGASGRWWTHDDTLEMLGGAEASDVPIERFEIEELAPSVVLATYDTGGSRPARRVSVWVLDGDQWRMRFHQGTLLTPVSFRECATDDLSTTALAQILDLCRACWPDGDFTTDDLEHALGGRHFLAEADGRVVGHTAVVPRMLELEGRPLRAGYVEAVATLPSFRRRGIASRLMADANRHIETTYELGALSTGEHRFYERLGWRRWTGETWVREPDGPLVRTEDEDDGVMVLATAALPPLTLAERLTCGWRPGDAW